MCSVVNELVKHEAKVDVADFGLEMMEWEEVIWPPIWRAEALGEVREDVERTQQSGEARLQDFDVRLRKFRT